jgi:hypothetical protein
VKQFRLYGMVDYDEHIQVDKKRALPRIMVKQRFIQNLPVAAKNDQPAFVGVVV